MLARATYRSLDQCWKCVSGWQAAGACSVHQWFRSEHGRRSEKRPSYVARPNSVRPTARHVDATRPIVAHWVTRRTFGRIHSGFRTPDCYFILPDSKNRLARRHSRRPAPPRGPIMSGRRHAQRPGKRPSQPPPLRLPHAAHEDTPPPATAAPVTSPTGHAALHRRGLLSPTTSGTLPARSGYDLRACWARRHGGRLQGQRPQLGTHRRPQNASPGRGTQPLGSGALFAVRALALARLDHANVIPHLQRRQVRRLAVLHHEAHGRRQPRPPPDETATARPPAILTRRSPARVSLFDGGASCTATESRFNIMLDRPGRAVGRRLGIASW